MPGTSRRPFLCSACRYKRKTARLKEPVPLISNSDTVAQLYLKRWAEMRRSGINVGVDNFAELVAPVQQIQQ